MKTICYFCTSPYQIMTALHLQMTLNSGIDADLFVIDQFPNADDVVGKIKKANMFGNAILIHESDVHKPGKNSKFRILYQELVAYINIKKITRTILKESFEVCYDTMYLSSKTFIVRLEATYFVKQYNTKIIYFDDGLGSYFNVNTFKPILLDKIIRRLLFGKCSKMIEPSTVLLYRPELFASADINCSNNLKIEPIPTWRRNPNLKKILNFIFAYREAESIKESIVIFDSFYSGKEREQLNHFYKKIFEIVGEKNIIIKKHPRNNDKEIMGLKYYKYQYLPFEIICLNSNIEDKLLIAVNTTAVITPVLLLNEEPNILVINNIPGLTNNHVNAHYDLFRELYSDKSKIYEADTIEDAINFVNKFVKTRNENNVSNSKQESLI